MKNAVVAEENFEVQKNARSPFYRFVYTTSKIRDLINGWLEANGSREHIDGFTECEIKKVLAYFRGTGTALSLETEMWIAKEN